MYVSLDILGIEKISERQGYIFVLTLGTFTCTKFDEFSKTFQPASAPPPHPIFGKQCRAFFGRPKNLQRNLFGLPQKPQRNFLDRK